MVCQALVIFVPTVGRIDPPSNTAPMPCSSTLVYPYLLYKPVACIEDGWDNFTSVCLLEPQVKLMPPFASIHVPNTPLIAVFWL